MIQNEEQTKSLFGTYNIMKAQTLVDGNSKKSSSKELGRARV